MSADILTFPGDGTQDRPITQEMTDKLFSKNFVDLEGRINNCALMTAIAFELAMPFMFGTEPKHERAQFAICKAVQMLEQLQKDYQTAWHGEIDLDSGDATSWPE